MTGRLLVSAARHWNHPAGDMLDRSLNASNIRSDSPITIFSVRPGSSPGAYDISAHMQNGRPVGRSLKADDFRPVRP